MGLLHRLRSDEALMLAFQRGDSHAFEVLYARHKDGLLRFLLGVGRASGLTREGAEELAQDSWASIIQSAENYRQQAKFTTYLFTVARNRWIDWGRKNRVRRDVDVSFDSGTGTDSDAETTNQLRNHAQVVVDGMMETAVDHQRLLRAIDQLPDEQRLAFLLKEEGFSLKEISEQLGQPVETIKSRLRYAKNRLRANFESRPKRAILEEGSV